MKINSPRRHLKVALTHLGRHLSTRHVQMLNAFVNYLEVGRWIQASGFTGFPRYSTRWGLHQAIAAPIADDQILYLEFGVFQGDSIRGWCELLRNPKSMLHGFDSFIGLPEDWDALRPTGTFSLQGRIPHFDDSRVVLHPGWFEETIPTLVLPEHERLVIHLDADLYSSTELVLRVLQDHIVPGTILIFDEFCDRFHELKAFDEYLERTAQRFSLMGATTNLKQAAFQRLP